MKAASETFMEPKKIKSNESLQKQVAKKLYKGFEFYPSASVESATNEYIFIVFVVFLAAIFIGVAAVFGVKYLISATQYYGPPQNCVSAQMQFDGWDYYLSCSKCSAGYKVNSRGMCV